MSPTRRDFVKAASFAAAAIVAGPRTLAAATAVRMRALTDFVDVVGDGRLAAFYHFNSSLVAKFPTGGLVMWGDVRGGGYGPPLLANGGLAGSAPIVTSQYVETDGISSVIAHSTATPLFPLDDSARTLMVWGEFPGATDGWGGVINGSEFETWIGAGGAVGWYSSSGRAAVSPKLRPAAGTRSLLIVSQNSRYPWEVAAGWGNTVRFEWVGRGVALTEGPSPNGPSSGALSLGGFNGSAFAQMRVRGIVQIDGALTSSDRAAIESLATLVDDADLYGAPDSKGLVLCLGDSLTYGIGASDTSTSTPADPAKRSYPSRLQARVNVDGLGVDVVNGGLPGQRIELWGNVQPGQQTSAVEDWCAFLSPARRVAGLGEVVVLWMGTNDLAFFGRSALQVATDLAMSVAKIRASGGKVTVCTLIPLRGLYDTSRETDRLLLNAWLLTNAIGADAVVDMRSVHEGGEFFLMDPSGPADTITANATWYAADGVHLTDRGYQRVADRLYESVRTVLFGSASINAGG